MRRERALGPEPTRAERLAAIRLLYPAWCSAERLLDGLTHFGLRALDLRIAELRAEEQARVAGARS